MTLNIRVLDDREQAEQKSQRDEELAKIAEELRSLHRAEQNAGFEMGRLLCRVAGSSLSASLPEREGRKDIAFWAKREVGLSYRTTARFMDVWRIKETFPTGGQDPSTTSQLDPLRPLLKHGREGRELLNIIWERACAESGRPEGPSRRLIAKVAKEEAPEIIGRKRPPKSRSKQKARTAIENLAAKFEKSTLRSALMEYLEELT